MPLAAGSLAVSARVHGLAERLDIEVLPPSTTDLLGDASLAEAAARGEPEFVGLSLYLWNTEKSLHLAREIKRRSPRTRILIGGPEVGPDNAFVQDQAGWDIAVTGEAEDTFAAGPDLDRDEAERQVACLPGDDEHGRIAGLVVRADDGQEILRMPALIGEGRLGEPLLDLPIVQMLDENVDVFRRHAPQPQPGGGDGRHPVLPAAI